MLPHIYWIHPDTDDRLRQANEAQAAAIYQRACRLACMSRAVFVLARGCGAALLRLAQGERRQAALAGSNI
ncbi:MAG: hypothetical protein JJU21_09490 [Salinarimonas sp.]|nr:hypothetical protein [Salinarimonas sp.]